MAPRASVLIPCFNYEQYVGEALHSALSQDWPELEVVVCDDGSTDGSWERIEKAAGDDSRLKAVRQGNRGLSSALDRAFAESTGEIIFFLDADDAFLPGKIQRVMKVFSDEPEIGLVVHRMRIVDAAGRPQVDVPYRLEEGDLRATLLRRGGLWRYIPGGQAMRRPIAEQVFPVPTEIRAPDAFMLTLAPLLAPVRAIREPLTLYRKHGSNMSLTHTQLWSGGARRGQALWEQVLDAVNERLEELGDTTALLEKERHLELRTLRLIADLFDGAPRRAVARELSQLGRELLADDMSHPLRRMANFAECAICAALPAKLRARWLSVSRSPRARELGVRVAMWRPWLVRRHRTVGLRHT